ncbi:MAG: helix-hairpin-helix domain-containing protein [Sulfuritalea sp.]|jgi:DNA uptake protein ComE-like DNA-binding protein|nr:helix-hairpin-helix domain-containing protein [Sulfuritalea sp.]
MKHSLIAFGLTTAVFLLGAQPSLAFVHKAEDTGDLRSDVSPKTKNTAASKAAAKIKPVDLNNATAEQLKKLPGITDAAAARIIAGRPYGSKSWLVIQNIITQAHYEKIKRRIVVGPLKDAAKNAAFLESLKKK